MTCTRRRLRRLTALLPYLLVVLPALACDTPPGLLLPVDAVEVAGPGGQTWIETGYENPIIEGFAPVVPAEFTIVNRFLPRSPLYLARQLAYGPTAVRFTVGAHAEFASLRLTSARILVDLPVRAIGHGVSLPMGGIPLPVTLEKVRLGSSELVDQKLYRLDPSVFVLPVHVTVFAREDGTVPYLGESERLASGILSQLFDPAGATPAAFAVRFPGGRAPAPTDYLVRTRRFGRFLDAEPDTLWYQCGIQFHVEEIEIEPQNQGLEQSLLASNDPCSPRFAGPLNDYLSPSHTATAIPVFVGGEITTMLLADTLGATCPPSASNHFVAMDGEEVLTPGVLAHELGHYLLGPDHSADRNNLMSTPSASSESIEGTSLTEGQCGAARCEAARLLLGYERLDQSSVNDACEGFIPICGDGVVGGHEDCDDGANGIDGDGCRDDCSEELCGDGVLDPQEECDWGDIEQRESCDIECYVCDDCNVCGDGIVGHGEECDDGNDNNKDDCNNFCNLTFI